MPDKNNRTVERLTLSVTEAAEALGISRRSMYELMHQEKFPAAAKILGRRVIIKSLLNDWLEQQAKEQKESALTLACQDGKGRVNRG